MSRAAEAERAAPSGQLMQIGEVAEHLGLTPRTLRYWEEKGLLPPAERMEGGFRLYSPADVERLERIAQLKKLLGFSLAEIRTVVEADEELQALKRQSRAETSPAKQRARRERAVAILTEQIAILDNHIAQMQALREGYEARIRRLRELLDESGGRAAE